jgi:SAM-dependent methyltransferase
MPTLARERALTPPPPSPIKGTMSPPAPARRSAPLWQQLWRSAFFKRSFYEMLGVVLWPQSGLQMLNCGYSAPGYQLPPASGDGESERLGCQLYHHLVRNVALTDRDVVEFGCGRGGGARYLAATFAPRSFLATDASRLLILGNRRKPVPLVRFVAATATRLPGPAASCDVLLGVEAMHALRDKAALLVEAARVLRPGGTLLLADFFYTRESSPQAAAGFRALAARAPLQLLAEEDWTANAVAALAEDSPRRLAAIDRLPRLLRKPALAFAGTTRSPLYRQLENGQAKYLFFKFTKPSTGVSSHA